MSALNFIVTSNVVYIIVIRWDWRNRDDECRLPLHLSRHIESLDMSH